MAGVGFQNYRIGEDRRAAAGHRFNNDLLMNPGDLDRAETAFPKMAHVLSHPTLQDAFRRFDLPANAAKKTGRIAGLLAIGMGAVALAIAAATPVYRHSRYISVFGGVSAAGCPFNRDRAWWGLVRGGQA